MVSHENIGLSSATHTPSCYVSALILGGALFAPYALPVLSPEGFIRYQDALHLTPPAVEHQQTGPLRQQIYADMFGWDEMTREVGRAYLNLPPDVRPKTAIAARGFGEAGAIDFFGSHADVSRNDC